MDVWPFPFLLSWRHYGTGQTFSPADMSPPTFVQLRCSMKMCIRLTVCLPKWWWLGRGFLLIAMLPHSPTTVVILVFFFMNEIFLPERERDTGAARNFSTGQISRTEEKKRGEQKRNEHLTAEYYVASRIRTQCRPHYFFFTRRVCILFSV